MQKCPLDWVSRPPSALAFLIAQDACPLKEGCCFEDGWSNVSDLPFDEILIVICMPQDRGEWHFMKNLKNSVINKANLILKTEVLFESDTSASAGRSKGKRPLGEVHEDTEDEETNEEEDPSEDEPSVREYISKNSKILRICNG
ncbi:uncharacterized protein G2W53_017562 [Senna tora]|uniref:Uncharacterized protein n=1 Tax=Senna tora TaxID=362788 RepID=A0A834WMJ9_9FABA|nr:uncharacterized protein G2W53_017562 [Senna tora]